MPIVRPFRGLIPPASLAPQVACVPYDVVNAKEAAALAQGNPLSLLHVDRAEIDLPAGTNPYSAAVYDKAAENLAAIQGKGALVRESKPVYYLYRQTMGQHVQRGVAAVCAVTDYESDIIKKHEKTRPEKEDDRTRLIDRIGAQTGPIFLAYKDSAELDAIFAKVEGQPPYVDFIAPDGIGHALWRIENTAPVEAAFAKLPCTYIADGHHRAASGARVAQKRRNGQAPDPAKSHEYILSVLFPASQLKILPYNRLVHDLNGLSVEAFVQKVRGIFTVKPVGDPVPKSSRHVCMYIAGQWYGLSWAADPVADPAAQLDVSVLQDRLLAPVLGIDNPRTNPRIEFIGGIRGTDELVQRVDKGDGAVAFSMYPTTVEQVMAIADAGQIMPPKSTWFEPKLRSGLFIHVLD
jgi:uncharacterized protein (DUF1015 family)